MRLLLSRLLIVFGIACLVSAAYLFWERNDPRRLSFNVGQITTVSSPVSQLIPKGIIIKDLDVSLPIYPASIKNGRWEATSKGVSFLISSVIPGEVGNSILYGHNWNSLLGRLVHIKPGQEIKIVFSDGITRSFIVAYTSVVSPAQTDILNQTGDRRLTLYTCTAFLDSKRFVAVAFARN